MIHSVLQGQQIDIPEQLLNKWEESAINATDVPLEVVNSSLQMDFAIRYNMSNSKFLRKVFKRQFICEKRYSELYTRIYNYEYQEMETSIVVTLPAPAFLTMTNNNQLLTNTVDYFNAIATLEYTDDQAAEKAEFIKLMVRHHSPSHINVPLIDKTKELAEINVSIKKKEDNEE